MSVASRQRKGSVTSVTSEVSIAPSKKRHGSISDASYATSITSISEPSICQPFCTDYVYELDNINFPKKLLFDDYACKHPLRELHFTNWLLSRECLTAIAKGAKGCQHISFNYALNLSINNFEYLRGLRDLRVVQLRGCIFLDEDIAQIITSWSNLRELDISENHVQEKAFIGMMKRSAKLSVLRCHKCVGIFDFSLQAIGAAMQKHRSLKVLDLSGCNDFSDEGMLSMLGSAFNILVELDISNCQNLTSLTITALRRSMNCLTKLTMQNMSLNPTAYEWITEGCAQLVSLDLTKCLNVADDALELLGKKCHQLQHLNLSYCENITDAGIVSFCREFAGTLLSLDLSFSNCASPSADALSAIAASIQDLRLNSLSQMSEQSLHNLWKACKSLIHFEMSADMKNPSTHRRSIIPHVSDKVLNQNKIRTLERLKLSCACMITDVGIKAVIEVSGNLRSLDISYCNHMTNETVLQLGRHCKQLTSLNICGLGNILDAGIIALCNFCTRLTRLEANGCFRITDYGASAIANLKELSVLGLNSCDRLTDVSIVAIAKSCYYLKHVDIGKLDMVTVTSIEALASHCPYLVRLNSTSCNLVPQEYFGHCKLLPLAQPISGRCKMEMRHKALQAYNNYVIQVKYHAKKCTLIQKIARGFVIRKNFRLYVRIREESAILIQKVFRGLKPRRAAQEHLKRQKIYRQNAFILQRQLRRLHGIRLAKKKKDKLKREYNATLLLQKTVRGHLCRKRIRYRFRFVKPRRTKIFMMAQRYMVLTSVRMFHQQLILVQRRVRTCATSLRYRRIINSIKRFQHFCRGYIAVRRVMNSLIEQMISDTYIRAHSAHRIVQAYYNTKHNNIILSFVTDCAQYYRNEADRYEWEMAVKCEQIVHLQRVFRGYRARLRIQREERALRFGYKSSIIIQTKYRQYIARKKYIPWRMHKKKVARNFRRLYKRGLNYYYGQQAAKIQRLVRRRQFLKARLHAAMLLQRVQRGHVARNQKRHLRYLLHMKCAAKIQQFFKDYMQRKFDKYMRAKRHIAIKRIQRVVRKRIEANAKRRVIAATRAREIKEEQDRKVKLLNEKRKKVIDKIKMTTRFRAAAKIQRRWRLYSGEKKKKKESEMNKKKMMLTMAEEVDEEKRRKQIKFPKLKLPRIPNPVHLAQNALRAVDSLINDDGEIQHHEQPKYMLSVLKYQTQSIRQVGIIDIAFTYGEGEETAFEQRQQFNKSTRRRYFEKLEGDLSGYLQLGICLWVMKGTGTECICQLKVKEKPKNSSVASLTNRCKNLRAKGVNLAWHEDIHVELHGICSLKQGQSGFAVDAIRICRDEAVRAQKDGFDLVQDMLEYNFPTSLWAHGKQEPPDESVFDLRAIETHDWFDDRMRSCCHKFNLNERDVMQMRHTFEAIQRGSYSFTVPLVDVFKYFKYPFITLVLWVVRAINPRDETNITFSEYMHMICYFCSFGEHEKIRFIFGAVCTPEQIITTVQFNKLVEILTEGFTGQRNVENYQRMFFDYCNPRLHVMFLEHFEKFIMTNQRIFWGVNELQVKFMSHNINQSYWEKKRQKFAKVREKLGVTVV